MSHKPADHMVYSEKPIKTRTLDLMHRAELARRDTNSLAPQPPPKAKAGTRKASPPR